MQRLGTLTDSHVVDALADTDPRVRRRAAMIAGTRRSISLLDVMRDPVPTVVEAAAWAAGPRPPGRFQEIDMSEPQVFERIRDEIGKHDVLLFMKGTPVFPQCGFSAAVVEVLSELGVKFHGINILIDPELRQGIKEFSQWPTIPQLYVKGEFVGGCDIIREMFETGELEQVMKDKGVTLANAA